MRRDLAAWMVCWTVACGPSVGSEANDASDADAETEDDEPMSERDRLKQQAKVRREQCDQLSETIGAADVRTQLVSINNAAGLKKAAKQVEANADDVKQIPVDDAGVQGTVDDYLGVLAEEATLLRAGVQKTGEDLKAHMKGFDALEEKRGDVVERMTEACNAPLKAP